MAGIELNCPNCGAPLKIEAGADATTRCPYCETTVGIPAELRERSVPLEPQIHVEVIDLRPRTASAPSKGGYTRSDWWILAAVLLGVGAVTALVLLLSENRQAAQAQARLTAQTATALAEFFNQTAAVTPPPPPTPSPTPQYAVPGLSFGGKGIGAGLFDNPAFIAVDGERTFYVADYEGGRVQRFNLSGDYLSQWRFGDSKTILHGMAATTDGDLYLAFDNGIARVEGSSGALRFRLTHPEGGEFGDLAVGADGRLYAVWYEGRWGFINTLEGHREELNIFSPQGDLLLALPNFISGQTEALALDVELAVDGLGTIYALESGIIYQFSPEGKFIDRIDHLGEGPGQIRSAQALAPDSQGNLYVLDNDQVSVFEKSQRFIDRFDSPAALKSLIIDPEGGLWGLADDRVIRFERSARP